MSENSKRLKGSYHEYEAHKRHWYRQSEQKFLTHYRRGGQRLGQYVWNMMGREGISWPELFYCENVYKVDELVYNEFYPQA